MHAWRFRGASVAAEGAAPIECSSLAGAWGTGRAGVTGQVVVVGDGRRARLDRLDLREKIALLDWRPHAAGIAEIGLELGSRGARAVIAVCLDGARRFQGPDALGTGVGCWYEGAPPVAITADARRRGPDRAMRIEHRQRHGQGHRRVDRQARGRNVVGVLGGDRPGAPIVVGAHHDGWFSGAFDNASGVASMLALARGIADAGWEPARPVWFVSHTGEEYALLDHDAPWCFGAWHQVAVEHPRWGSTVPFYLDIEASGRPEFPLLVVAPRELRRFASRRCRQAQREGLLPSGWRLADPVTGTHQWPFQLRGVPASASSTGTRSSNAPTTTRPTTPPTGSITPTSQTSHGSTPPCSSTLTAIRTRCSTSRARARHITAVAGRTAAEGLEAAADGYAQAASRRAFTRLARAGFGLDDHWSDRLSARAGRGGRPPADPALERLRQGDRRRAARAAAAVGTNAGHAWRLRRHVADGGAAAADARRLVEQAEPPDRVARPVGRDRQPPRRARQPSAGRLARALAGTAPGPVGRRIERAASSRLPGRWAQADVTPGYGTTASSCGTSAAGSRWTLCAPALRSSPSEIPPHSSASIRTSSAAAARQSHTVSPIMATAGTPARSMATCSRSGSGFVRSTSAEVVTWSTRSFASSRREVVLHLLRAR